MVPGESSHPDGSEYVWQRGVQSLYGRVREPMIEQLTMRSGDPGIWGLRLQTSFVFFIIMMMILFVNIIKFKHSRSPASLGLSTISSWFPVRIMEGPIPFKKQTYITAYTTQLLLLGKFEYTGGPIFKVVLEC